jgi:hypothetical protein
MDRFSMKGDRGHHQQDSGQASNTFTGGDEALFYAGFGEPSKVLAYDFSAF